MKFKYAEWREIEPRLDEGVDELIIHMEAMTGISNESMLIYKEVGDQNQVQAAEGWDTGKNRCTE